MAQSAACVGLTRGPSGPCPGAFGLTGNDAPRYGAT